MQSVSGGEIVNNTITATQIDETDNYTWTGTHDFSGGLMTLDQGSAPAPTVEGRIEWETDDDHIIIGDGSAQVEFIPAEDVSGDITMTDAGATSLSIDVVAPAEMADADHGDVSWSGGVATVDNVVAANVANGLVSSQVDSVGLNGIVTHVQYDPSYWQFAVDSANGLTADTTWIIQNWEGGTVTIDSIYVTASADNYAITFFERDFAGGNVQTIDVVTASTDGANMFHITETTITGAAIEEGNWIGFLRPTGTANNLYARIHYDKPAIP